MKGTTHYINEYINDILTDRESYRVQINHSDTYLYVKIILSKQHNDAVILKMNRSLSKKGYYFFANDTPQGKFPLTNKLKEHLIEFLKMKGIFNKRIKK